MAIYLENGFAGEKGHMTSHPLHPAILGCLRHGEAQAITCRRLASACGGLGVDERKVRLAIKELIGEGYPVASLVDPPYGYFLVSSWAEAERYRAQMTARMGEMGARMRAFDKAAELHLGQGRQMAMRI